MDLQDFYLAQSSRDFLISTLESCGDIKGQARFINKSLRENTIYIQFTFMSLERRNGMDVVKFVLKSRRYTFIYEFNMTTKELVQKGAKEIVKVGVTK